MPNYNLRWRIVGGQIPLLNRHYRALEPLNLPEPLLAWIHERLEWAADNMLYQDQDAVICLAIDPEKDVVVSLDKTCPQPELSVQNILCSQGIIAGIKYQNQPLQATVWLEKDGQLTAALSPNADKLSTATDTLAFQLAETLGMTPKVRTVNCESVESANVVFAISDEFGFLPIKNVGAAGSASTARAVGSASAARATGAVGVVGSARPDGARSGQTVQSAPGQSAGQTTGSMAARIADCFRKVFEPCSADAVIAASQKSPANSSVPPQLG